MGDIADDFEFGNNAVFPERKAESVVECECVSPSICKNADRCTRHNLKLSAVNMQFLSLDTAAAVGLRYDTGKPRYDLIPPAPYKALAQHSAAGATKYLDRNWEKGMPWGTCLRAAESHLTEWKLGHPLDPVDPKMPEGYRAHHLISAIWNLMVLYEYERRAIGTDDRPVAQFDNPYPEDV